MLRRILFALAVGFLALALAQDTSDGNAQTVPASVQGATVAPPNQFSTTNTSAPDTNTSSAPLASTTIVPPANTTAAPTNTTAAPTNTTTAPHTSTTITPSTNTTIAPHSSTTSTTSPSTQVPTTEPPAPTTTLPPPAKNHYYVREENETCIIADLAVQVMLVVDNKTREFDVPANITFGGSCANVSQVLNLSWVDVDGKNNDTLIFQFAKNGSKFMVSSLNLTVPFHNGTVNLTNSKPLFTASVSKSYRCEKEQEIKLQSIETEMNDTYAILKISHLQLEAFNTKENDDKFSAAEDCASPYSPDIVPIAVGCALVGLIAIVLIAYLVGRRRSQARGYLSM